MIFYKAMTIIERTKWNLKRRFRGINALISNLFAGHITISKTKNNYVKYNESNTFTTSLENYSYEDSSPYWFEFKDVLLNPLWSISSKTRVIGRGILVDGSNAVILESTIGQKEYLDRLGSNHFLFFNRAFSAASLEKGILLSNALEHNYYHWMLESLGRLTFLKKKDILEYPIILNTRAKKFAIDSLVELFEIPIENIFFKKEFSVLEVQDTLIPSFPITRNESTKMTNIYHPYIIKKLNTLALTKIVFEKKINFIISRKKATERRIEGATLIQETFPNLDFKIIILENYSFKEQMNLFTNAGVIIATHGAISLNIPLSIVNKI